MAKINLRKTISGFEPDQDYDKKLVSKLKIGEIYQAEIKKPRNILFHRKFFALLNLGFDNQDRYDVFEHFRKEVTMRCGHYDEHVTVTGQIFYFPKSISFASIDEIEFQKLYECAIDVILKYFITGSTPEEIDQAVLQVLDFS